MLSRHSKQGKENDGKKPLPLAVQEALHAALDDEYKAFALYGDILRRFGEARPFTNIIEAEVRHADAITLLMKTYGMNVPNNPYLSGAKPLPQVPATIEEACEMGMQAELENVALYRDDILPAVADYADITATMINLRDASQNNHLPAFQRCVARGGGAGHGRGNGGGRRQRHRRGNRQNSSRPF